MNQIINFTTAELSTHFGDRFKVKESDPVKGHWNCEGVRRIIENICTNAIKYGDDKASVLLQIDPSAEGLLLSISNQGRPIPEEEGKKGRGLGPTLVKGLTEAHGGTSIV